MTAEQQAPRTEAGRRMLSGIQETSERLDVALNALDYIRAIEQEAARPIEETAKRAHRFIGGITPEQWAAIDKLTEAEDVSEAIDRAVVWDEAARPLPELQPELDTAILGRAIHRVFRHGVHGPGRDDGDGDLAAAILDEYAELGGALPDRSEPSLTVERLEPIFHDILPHLHGPHEKRPNLYYVEVAEKFLARLSQPPDPATAHEDENDR